MEIAGQQFDSNVAQIQFGNLDPKVAVPVNVPAGIVPFPIPNAGLTAGYPNAGLTAGYEGGPNGGGLAGKFIFNGSKTLMLLIKFVFMLQNFINSSNPLFQLG